MAGPGGVPGFFFSSQGLDGLLLCTGSLPACAQPGGCQPMAAPSSYWLLEADTCLPVRAVYPLAAWQVSTAQQGGPPELGALWPVTLQLRPPRVTAGPGLELGRPAGPAPGSGSLASSSPTALTAARTAPGPGPATELRHPAVAARRRLMTAGLRAQRRRCRRRCRHPRRQPQRARRQRRQPALPWPPPPPAPARPASWPCPAAALCLASTGVDQPCRRRHRHFPPPPPPPAAAAWGCMCTRIVAVSSTAKGCRRGYCDTMPPRQKHKCF